MDPTLALAIGLAVELADVILRKIAENNEEHAGTLNLARALLQEGYQRMPVFMELAQKYQAGTLTFEDMKVKSLEEINRLIDEKYHRGA
jgi:hypothetical protein